MGLDKNDTIIRRRLAQKLEFLFRDLADLSQPTDQQLQAYFDANLQRYQESAVITFTQVFVDPDRRGERTGAEAENILARLKALKGPMQDIDGLGDSFMLQLHYRRRSEQEVAKLFGPGFAGPVFKLPVGQWHGPVLSGYGVHLVYVHERSQPPEASFESARESLVQDYRDDRRRQLYDKQCEMLIARYNVIIQDDDPKASR